MGAWSGLGITFGWHTASGGYDLSAELDYIKSRGINRVRLIANVYTTSFRDWARSTQLVAKGKEFYVIGGCSAAGIPGGVLTTSNIADYSSKVVAEAVIAEASEVDEFCIGNEEELRIDNSTIVDPFALYDTHLKGIATAVRAVYSGIISICISNGAESWIFNITPGNIDKVGFNVYGDSGARASFQSRIAAFKANENWGDRLYISEFNTHYDSTAWTTQALRPEKMADEIAARQKIIQDAGITEAYYFCWRWDNTQNFFSAWNADGSYNLLWNVLTTNNKRPWFTNS